MKINLKWVAGLLLIIALVFGVIFCGFSDEERNSEEINIEKTENTIALNNKKFIENVKKLRDKKDITTLQELTDFEWDEVYQFLPYAYPGDIVGDMKGVDFGTSLEGTEEVNILFLDESEPVCYIFGAPENLGIDINIWDHSDSRNYVMYKNSNINTLAVDDRKENCICLHVANEKNREIYRDLFQDTDENDLIESYPSEATE